MPNQSISFYASPERLSPSRILEESQLFGNFEIGELLVALPVIVLILNRCRQVVYANQRFLDIVGAADPVNVYGLRPGEALGCVNALTAPSGCGTHEFCRSCGAVNAILESQKGARSVKECVISCTSGGDFELRVWATPLRHDDRDFTIFSAVDISDENRKKSLEQIFFHDISNTVAGIYGTSELLRESMPKDAFTWEIDTIFHASEWLIEEIKYHKKLVEAEAGELESQPMTLSALATLKQCIRLYTQNKSTQSRVLTIAPETQDVRLVTDGVLLRRILINMIKNALEATAEGGEVLVSCFSHGDLVCFSVHNPSFIPVAVQSGIFKRTFSTKGKGRGVGTYSMKLFSERYLGGRVAFTSSMETGTTFTLSLPLTIKIS